MHVLEDLTQDRVTRRVRARHGGHFACSARRGWGADSRCAGGRVAGCNIDIRDTVNYKEVMKQYQLGPNGGIMTALNLFATKFDQVMELIERKADELEVPLPITDRTILPRVLLVYSPPVYVHAFLVVTTERIFPTLQHVFVDTPGQIEIFTWSASGVRPTL
jgi:GTPase SAR1 family protein